MLFEDGAIGLIDEAPQRHAGSGIRNAHPDMRLRTGKANGKASIRAAQVQESSKRPRAFICAKNSLRARSGPPLHATRIKRL
jgi:hypothetical protein